MRYFFLFVIIFWSTEHALLAAHQVTNRISLAGEWRFSTDPSDKGISEQWFTKKMSDKIVLPGSMATNAKGDDLSLKTKFTGQIVDSAFYSKAEYAKYREAGNLKFPFWLQSLKYYVGAAWYQKEVVIPKEWNNQSIELFLERCHWESRVWVDTQEVGVQNSLGTPHKYNLSKCLVPGTHLLTICVDNRIKSIDPGINSHSVSDHTQTNWNGIVGEIFLSAKSITIKNIQIFLNILQQKFVPKLKWKTPCYRSRMQSFYSK